MKINIDKITQTIIGRWVSLISQEASHPPGGIRGIGQQSTKQQRDENYSLTLVVDVLSVNSSPGKESSIFLHADTQISYSNSHVIRYI